MGENKLYTIGEFSKKAGVTLRTLRYYDNINLLKPSCYNEKGHRFYSDEDFKLLQKIITLKFIGFSLDQIKQIIKDDLKEEDFLYSLSLQKNIVEKKIKHMQDVLTSITEALNIASFNKSLGPEEYVNIIRTINSHNNWLEQYNNSSNLKARINIHDEFSTNSEGWHPWFFSNLPNLCELKVLEIGCGDGSLWKKNRDKLPINLNLTLSDFSSGMINDAKENLKDFPCNLNFVKCNAEDLPFENESYDLVIGNHMLYHVSDIDKTLNEVYRVLKPNGAFFCATVGNTHMKELKKIIKLFYNNYDLEDFTKNFNLENGYDILKKHFNNIEIKRYEDNLIVTSKDAIVDYILSLPKNMKDIFKKETLASLENYLERQITENKGIFISKDSGFFKCLK